MMENKDMEKLKNTILGRIPLGWSVENLEDNLEKIIDYRGKTPTKAESGIITLSAKSVKMNYIDYSNAYYVSKETYDKFMVRGFPKKGDILMTTEAPLGCIAELNKEDVCVAQRLLTLRGKKEKLLNKYLMYYLQSNIGQHELLSKASGTTVQGIKRTEFSKVNIILPPLETQEKIASILSALDDKIEINNEMNKTLEEMAQTLFKRWFIDFDFPNENGEPYRSSGGKMVDSELGEIPEGWEVSNLGDLFKFVKGKKPKIVSENFSEETPLKYLTIKGFNGDENLYASEDKTILINKKDIVMVMDGASSGDVYIGKSGVLGSTFSKIEKIKEIDWSYIYLILKYYEGDIKSHTTGSAIPHTDKGYVEKIRVSLPNLELLNILSKKISGIIKRKLINQEEIQSLTEIRDILLPKLMSGEVEV